MKSGNISHYQLLETIGEGGMGEVYLAEDTLLRRRVAIKFLSSSLNEDERAKKRLIREARSAAKLDHPNICTIYEIGEADGQNFIVMQYVEGENLAKKCRGKRLSIRDSLAIAAQVTDALADAHAHGIVHRDLKPENIMIGPKGQVKVLDFGLAKTLADNTTVNDQTASLLSETGTIVGTVPYMSPEQVKGEELDARTDIFSIGTILYEMISGKQPFLTPSRAQSIAAILTVDPSPLTTYGRNIPLSVDRLVRRCLEKNSERRYQSARELANDLKNIQQDIYSAATLKESTHEYSHGFQAGNVLRRRWMIISLLAAAIIMGIGGWFWLSRKWPGANNSAGRVINSVAVLPFANESNKPEIDYVCDGLTESLINNLSRLSTMKIIARTSVIRYKGQSIDPQTVGRNLRVQALLIGHVTQRGDDYSISVELVDVETNSRLWGEQYHRNSADLLLVQGEMSKDITAKLQPTLSGGKHVPKDYTRNKEAYELYLKGRYQWNKRTVDSLARAANYFQQAIEKDPNYALAYVGLADSYLVGRIVPGTETAAKASEAALRALSIDPNLAEAHASLGFARSRYDWNWEEAQKEFQRAIQLNPNYSVAYSWYADLLMALDRQSEALAQLSKAQELDPLSSTISTNIGQAIFYQRDYDRAIEQFRKVLEMDREFWAAHFRLGLAYNQKGNHAEAINELQTAVSLSGNSPTPLAMLGYVYGVSGQPAKAREILGQLNELTKQRYVSPYHFAVVHIGLKQKNEAFAWLEKAYEQHDAALVALKVEPWFDTLRSDPRFASLTQRVGLAG